MYNNINKQRRQLLKGVGVSSAFLASGSLWAAASQEILNAEAMAMCAIITPDAAGKQFLTSLEAKTTQVMYGSTDLSFITQLQSVLGTSTAQWVVAFLDSASTTLVMDMARDVNAKLFWEQSHLKNGSHYTSFLLKA